MSRNRTYNDSAINKTAKSLQDYIFYGVVVDIIDGPESPGFFQYGSWNSVGMIQFRKVTGDQGSIEFFAKPYFSFLSYMPLIGERVLILNPSTNFEDGNDDIPVLNYYYFPPLNVKNNINNNIKEINSDLNSSENQRIINNRPPRDQKSIDYYLEGKVLDKTNLGASPTPTRKNIPDNLPTRLKTFPGDLIINSRFGSGIRFGSTGLANTTPWSTRPTGDQNNPLITITSGINKISRSVLKETELSEETYGSQNIPEAEDPRYDASSIWLSTSQRLPITPINSKAEIKPFSTERKPEPLIEYNRPQVLLSSGRLVLNAKSDSILGYANQTINFNTSWFGVQAYESFNINSPKILLGSDGDAELEQNLVLGKRLNEMLSNLIDTLVILLGERGLQNINNWPEGIEVPNEDVILQCTNAINNLKSLKSNYLSEQSKSTILSKVVKTL